MTTGGRCTKIRNAIRLRKQPIRAYQDAHQAGVKEMSAKKTSKNDGDGKLERGKLREGSVIREEAQ